MWFPQMIKFTTALIASDKTMQNDLMFSQDNNQSTDKSDGSIQLTIAFDLFTWINWFEDWGFQFMLL